jgi:hypothetical protein
MLAADRRAEESIHQTRNIPIKDACTLLYYLARCEDGEGIDREDAARPVILRWPAAASVYVPVTEAI